MEKLKKWYYSVGREDMPDGLNLIEVEPFENAKGFRFDEFEYISDSRVGDTREECLENKIRTLTACNKFYYDRMQKPKDDEYIYMKSCGNHLGIIKFGEPTGKCDICE